MSEAVRTMVRDFLVRRALQLVMERRLPLYDLRPVSAGMGPSTDCCLCGRSIEAQQLRYSLERPEQNAEFHVLCFLAWEEVSLKHGLEAKH